MRIIKTALITLTAVCIAATSALARETKSGTRSKSSSSSSSSAKKKKSGSGGNKSAKSRAAKKSGTSSQRFEGFAEELPPEDLPVEEEPSGE